MGALALRAHFLFCMYERNGKKMKKSLKFLVVFLSCIALVAALTACDGDSPSIEINEDGYWVINGEITDVKAQGAQGIQGIQGEKGDSGETPTIEISADGYWVINGEKTSHKAIGTDGSNGTNGTTPTIEISADGYWVINGVKSDVKARGEDATVTDENPQGLAFYLKDDDTYAVAVGSAKYLSRIEIPATYKGKAVTEIADNGFLAIVPGLDVITIKAKEIIIPESVTRIGYAAFAYCQNLSQVVIPDSVTYVDSYAFGGCQNLVSITVGNSVEYIGDDAFIMCPKLVEVINKSELDIVAGSDDHGGIASHEIAVVHNGETKIKNQNGYLFYTDGEHFLLGYVGNETSIVLPESYNGEGYEICPYSFAYSEIVSLTIPDGEETYVSPYAFEGCQNLKSVIIGDSVTSIGSFAFYRCWSLTSIEIPDSVTSIGFSAFSGCNRLTEITLPFVGATKDGTGYTHFGYIFGSFNYGDNSYYVPSSLKTVIITGGTSIGSYAFEDCSSLTSIVITDSVTTIGDEAFLRCSSLASIVIPDSVTGIGSCAFYDCTSLTSIKYCGTEDEWNDITKGSNWDYTGNYTITYNYTEE